MARTELERSVQQSILDRLTDLEPRQSGDHSLTRDESERAYRIAVQRDIEWLLNTRRTIVHIGPEHRELRASVHEYGIMDTTGIAAGTPEGRTVLLEEVRDAIVRFEPRLTNVRVTLGDASQLRTPQLRFTVHATLRMDPSPEEVVFDTVLEVASGTYAVEDSVSDSAH